MSDTRNPKPNRAPDAELSGSDVPPDHVRERTDAAYYAETFIDALGGWWHVKIWEAP
jgi:hypothetical protein